MRARLRMTVPAGSLVLAACGTVLGFQDISYSVAASDGGIDVDQVGEGSGDDGGGHLPDANGGDGGAPFIVATAVNPREVALDGDDVYWVAGDADGGARVERASMDGGPVTRAVDGEDSIARIALTPTYLYYAASALKRVRKDGLTSSEHVFPPGGRFPASSFTWLGNTTYFTESGTTGSVWGCSGDPCSTATMIADLPLVSPQTITAANGSLFVSDGVVPGNAPARLRRIDADGGIDLLALSPMVRSVADDQYLYFTLWSDKPHVLRVALDAPPLDGGVGDPDVLAQGKGPARHLASDGTHVYWLTAGPSGFLHRVARGASAVDTLVEGIRNGSGLAVDDRHVCWSETDIGAIRCRTK